MKHNEFKIFGLYVLSGSLDDDDFGWLLMYNLWERATYENIFRSHAIKTMRLVSVPSCLMQTNNYSYVFRCVNMSLHVRIV